MHGREESIIKPATPISTGVIRMADKGKKHTGDFDSVFKRLVSQNKRALDILSKQ